MVNGVQRLQIRVEISDDGTGSVVDREVIQINYGSEDTFLS